MNKIRLHLGNLTVAELINYARRVQSGMCESPDFAALESELTLLEEEIHELAERHSAHEAAVRLAQERLAERNLVRGSVEALLNELAASVACLAEADASLIHKSRFEARAFAGLRAMRVGDFQQTISTAA